MTAGIQVDIHSAEYIANPYPTLARLREEEPVFWNGVQGFWMVTRYDGVVSVAKNYRDFSSQNARAKLVPGNDPALRKALRKTARDMIESDPPDHTRLRRLVAQAFTPRRVAEMEPRIRRMSAALVENATRGLQPGDSFDLVRALSNPLPTMEIADILGIPLDMQDTFKRWTDSFLLAAVVQGYDQQEALRDAQALNRYLRDLIAERRERPGDDLSSALAQAADPEAGSLTAEEAAMTIGLILRAGNETTTSLISNATAALLADPEVYARLRLEPSLMPQFLEEALRYDAPVQAMFRVAARDVELGGRTIEQGQKVWVIWASANRDGAHFPDPDRFDLMRNPKDHVAFGDGIHFCLGASLARLEARIAFEALLERVPQLRPGPAPAVKLRTSVLHGYKSLPVTLG